MIVGTSIKFWSQIYKNIWKYENLGYFMKNVTVNRNFLKKNRKNPIFWGKSMSYNVVFLCIKDFWWNFIFETLEKCVKPSIETFLKKIAKIQFFEENQCRTMLYFCVSRIFDEISLLKLWTIKINNIFHK